MAGSIEEAVRAKEYITALERQAIRLAYLLDNLEDERNAAGISRELRITLEKIGIKPEEMGDALDKLVTLVRNKQ